MGFQDLTQKYQINISIYLFQAHVLYVEKTIQLIVSKYHHFKFQSKQNPFSLHLFLMIAWKCWGFLFHLSILFRFIYSVFEYTLSVCVCVCVCVCVYVSYHWLSDH